MSDGTDGASGRPSDGGPATGKRATVSQRHQGRALALQVLYELDLTAHDPAATLARTFAEQPTPPPIRAYVERLVRGVLARRDEIDPYVAAAAPAFPLARLAAVDRNVLRLAVYELLHEPDVPPKAVINEAVELAKRFGGDSSSRFVNGVLGTIVEQVPRATKQSGRRRQGARERAQTGEPGSSGEA